MSPVNVQVFTDFDGTLSLDGKQEEEKDVENSTNKIRIDTGLILIDDHRSMGPERRKTLDHAILEGTKTYREALQEMWNSVHISWEEAWTEYLDGKERLFLTVLLFFFYSSSRYKIDCKIDPGFPSFNDYCRENKFPVTVLSR